jgi:hypothetical protein
MSSGGKNMTSRKRKKRKEKCDRKRRKDQG